VTIDAAIDQRFRRTYDAVLFRHPPSRGLLTALMAALKLRTRRPAAHISLV